MDDPLDDRVERCPAVHLGPIKVEIKMRVGSANPPQAECHEQNASEEPDMVATAITRQDRNDGLVAIRGPEVPNMPSCRSQYGKSGLIDPVPRSSAGTMCNDP